MADSYLTPLPQEVKLSPDLARALGDIQDQFHLGRDTLKRIEERFRWEFTKGLSEYPGEDAKETFLPMIPTFIHDVPNGTETGTFLALDLGGTNLRVCEVRLNGDHTFKIRQQKYKVSDTLKKGDAKALFDYIAISVDKFLTEMGTETNPNDKLFLGFTFSFPVQQTALGKGTLITWTKGFEAKNAVGNDVVQLLQDALDRKHIHVKCSALVNDTVGTLMARAYQAGDALAGAIFGTGTNGAYVEEMRKLTKLTKTTGKSAEELAKDAGETMIVNTEWGAFDNQRKVLPVTPFDNKLDRESINPRKQAFEKMVSGMYLGEITRNVILHLIDHSLLFNGHSSEQLNSHYGLDTALMSALEDDGSSSIENTRRILTEQLGLPNDVVTDQDCVVVRRVSEVVGTRGSRLSACAVAAVTLQTGREKDGEVHVGVDGSVVEHYPRFEERVRQALRDILGSEVEKRIKIGLAKDGSGVGAALCALQAKKQEKSGKALTLSS